jgi:predicted glycosyltransferase
VPRTAPRQEQYLRAERASRLGLVRMLPDDGVRSPRRMAEELHALAGWPRPRPAQIPGLLGGLERIAERAAPWLDLKEQPLPRSA